MRNKHHIHVCTEKSDTGILSHYYERKKNNCYNNLPFSKFLIMPYKGNLMLITN